MIPVETVITWVLISLLGLPLAAIYARVITHGIVTAGCEARESFARKMMVEIRRRQSKHSYQTPKEC